MRITRHVVQRSKQLLVPIPPAVRDHLGLVGTAEVYWHVEAKGRVILTVSGQVRGWRPREGTDCPSCVRYREELDHLRERLRAAPEAALRRFRMQEWLTRLRIELRGLPELGAINDRLRRIEDLVGTRRGPWSYKVKRGAGRYRKIEESPAPILSPQAESGGADTSGGAAPQVSHSEKETHGP